MDLALFVLRAVVGLFFAGHGAQKLFGAFGGHGIAGTAKFFESIGMRPGTLQARAAGSAELAGGLLLVLGLFTPLAAAMIISVMVVAIITVHASNGPWVTDSGYEYNAVLIAAAFALAGAGAGAISLDSAFGLDLAGTGWALASLGAGILGAVGAVVMGRRARGESSPAPTATETPVRSGRFDREDAEERTPAEVG